MNRRHLASLSLIGILVWLAVTGCGDKIAIPQASGDFSVARYIPAGAFEDDDPRQLLSVQNILFVLTADSLSKRSYNYDLIKSVGGFDDPTAMCSDDADMLIFVWDQGLGRVIWFQASDLESPAGLPNTADLPEVQSCTGMTTSRAGIEQVPGATTYLYLADPDSGVVHRYAYEEFTGLIPHGVLCLASGEGTRFVHDPAGLARDWADSLLVCDRDPERNWVIRFNSIPDLEDITIDGVDLFRGKSALFRAPVCNPPAANEFVIGNADSCGETEWVGGPSAAEGEFDQPVAVTVDGIGQIYISDHENDRIQIFFPDGLYDVAYGDPEVMPSPQSLAVVDIRGEAATVFYGAHIYVICNNEVRLYISGEYSSFDSEYEPPPD